MVARRVSEEPIVAFASVKVALPSVYIHSAFGSELTGIFSAVFFGRFFKAGVYPKTSCGVTG